MVVARTSHHTEPSFSQEKFPELFLIFSPGRFDRGSMGPCPPSPDMWRFCLCRFPFSPGYPLPRVLCPYSLRGKTVSFSTSSMVSAISKLPGMLRADCLDRERVLVLKAGPNWSVLLPDCPDWSMVPVDTDSLISLMEGLRIV